jgi:hypothetical protein
MIVVLVITGNNRIIGGTYKYGYGGMWQISCYLLCNARSATRKF